MLKPKQRKHSTKPTRDPATFAAFGMVLRRFRQQRQLTQEQLAWNSEMDRTFISELELGKKEPGLVTILILARALEVPAATLIAEVELALQNR